MKPYYQDNHDTLHCADFRTNDLPDESVQMVCTSPPYWGLRKYSGEQDLVWGEDKDCEHQWVDRKYLMHSGRGDAQKSGKYSTQEPIPDMPILDNTCSLCGAWKGAYGLEPTPEMYVQHTIEILREIRRVLRKDGVVFWNLGDSYWGGKGQSGQPMSAAVQQERHGRGESINQAQHQMEMSTRPQDGKHPTLKPKDLCLIPFRVALEAQADGWYVRSVIIWSKPNPMPESVTDRPTESHEYILMLTKSARYYWDADAVREPQSEGSLERWGNDGQRRMGDKAKDREGNPTNFTYKGLLPAGRNIRSVWEFPTQPFPEAHFAVFPEKLPETCIKAATPEVGCCSKCGAPWERVVEIKQYSRHDTEPHDLATDGDGANRGKHVKPTETKTLGWQPTCKCNADKVPSLVLDPFAGAGTTLWGAKKLNRKAVGYELSEEYCHLARERCRQQVMELNID